ncbi:hypothetical protein RF11_07704 [Thelohanellus kitauei]|uniref:Uncharacterized protein n=1 Tax=Thelohanellus kitauei TaxID=669202 RepID=A0A0C2MJF6_THEKT|nr:hypothetical protein RF11_07704 [Thelohanellus kitauei]
MNFIVNSEHGKGYDNEDYEIFIQNKIQEKLVINQTQISLVFQRRQASHLPEEGDYGLLTTRRTSGRLASCWHVTTGSSAIESNGAWAIFCLLFCHLLPFVGSAFVYWWATVSCAHEA